MNEKIARYPITRKWNMRQKKKAQREKKVHTYTSSMLEKANPTGE